MKTKRIVITGGPGSGKTSLIHYFESQGHACLSEISREVTLKAQQEGVEQLFLEQPLLFSKLLLEGRLKQFHQASDFNVDYLFYDRGLPDIPSYMDYLGTSYPQEFVQTCETYRYDAIFLLPPWEEIYIRDNERYESYAEAESIFSYLDQGYAHSEYKVHHVPVGSLEYRASFILETLNHLF